MRDGGYDPRPGTAETLMPGVRRVLARNPGPMTFRGTNTYLVGAGEVAVIDPGPDEPAHLAAILAALAPGERVTAILVTHPHRDHSPLAPRLATATGAPVMAWGTPSDGRSAVMQRLAETGAAGGGEGVDTEFRPDVRLGDGAAIALGGDRITALWTPGHMASHLCFVWRDAIFTGDLVMGWASSLISPPDGDLSAFMASCKRLEARPERLYLPGHGAPVADGPARAADLRAHRAARTDQVRAALAAGPASLATLTAQVYADVDRALHPAAARNLFAHLVALHEAGEIEARPCLDPAGTFRRTGPARRRKNATTPLDGP